MLAGSAGPPHTMITSRLSHGKRSVLSWTLCTKTWRSATSSTSAQALGIWRVPLAHEVPVSWVSILRTAWSLRLARIIQTSSSDRAMRNNCRSQTRVLMLPFVPSGCCISETRRRVCVKRSAFCGRVAGSHFPLGYRQSEGSIFIGLSDLRYSSTGLRASSCQRHRLHSVSPTPPSAEAS